ncbi:MAG: glutathione S-transferase family protein [Rhodobacteraceae bacterium]|nr:glutathione S-transferase family protein [Paracoccaceae bacterium]
MALTLIGYRFSIYTRVVRLVLAEKRLRATLVEVDPFRPPLPADFLALNPFGRVPVLQHGPFTIYETAAICRYLDEALPGPALQPEDARDRARMAQVVAIVDADGYRPLIRQVFAHRVFRPAEGLAPDPAAIAKGLAAAGRLLRVLDGIAQEGRVLGPERITLADLHLAPMIAAFVQAPEGADLLAQHVTLSGWWAALKGRPSLRDTEPGLPA